MSQNKLTCVFMGTPSFAVPSLRALHKHPLCDLVAVFTQPDRPRGRGQKKLPPPVAMAALELKIPVFQYENINTEESLLKLQNIKPDLIFVIAFGQLLKSSILDLPNVGCFNAHASLLPSLRGAAPIQWCLIHGYEETGVSIIKLIKKMDAGPIVLQEKINIAAMDSYQDLHDKLANLSAKLLSKTLELAYDKKLSFRPQDEARATYAPKIEKKDCEINWNQSNISILNFIRALYPAPGTFTYIQGKRLKILKASPTSITSSLPPGSIESSSQDGVLVHTKDYCILITEVQLENKKRMNASQLMNGVVISKGIILGQLIQNCCILSLR